MKIAWYVGELLFDYECVVIPGLGGFIAEDKPVTINKVTDKFSPPYRKIHFNIHLRANDGLLVNFVAQEEQISYKTAKQRVDKFVFLCHNALEAGKKINFKNIGSIYFDEDKNVVFKQDEKINFNADSFGLTTLVSPSVRRITDEEKIKKVVKSAIDNTRQKTKPSKRIDSKPKEKIIATTHRMQASPRPSSLRNQIVFLALLIFFMGIGYSYMRRDAMKFYFDKYSSHIPLLYSSVNDYLTSNINSTPVASLSRGTASFFPLVLNDDDQPVADDNEMVRLSDSSFLTEQITPEEIDYVIEDASNENSPGVDKEIIVDEPKEEITDNPVIEKENKVEVPDIKPSLSIERFFLIAGSFSNEENAKRLVLELKQQGYNALIADTNKYGMYRVAFTSFSNRHDANQQLLAIREDTNPKAWLLVK